MEEIQVGKIWAFLIGDRELPPLILILSASLILRFILSPVDGYYLDLNTFTSWFYTASGGIITDFYRDIWCDYPPFNVVIFWIFGYIARSLSLFGTPFLMYIIKLPSNLFDIGTSILIFFFLRGRVGRRCSITASAAYSFNPAAIFNTSFWGQFDAIYTFFILMSLMLILDGKPKASYTAFALAVLSKPQALAFLPILCLIVVKRFSWYDVFKSFASYLATILFFILPFDPKSPIDFALSLYLGGYSQYRLASLNAFNIWSFFGFTVKDTVELIPFITYQIVGWIIFGGLLCLMLYYASSKSSSDSDDYLMVYLTCIVFLAFFMFLTRMHERYLFPVIALSLLSVFYSRKASLIFLALTTTLLFNQAYALHFLNKRMFVPNGDPLAYTISLINLAVFSYSIYLLISKESFARES